MVLRSIELTIYFTFQMFDYKLGVANKNYKQTTHRIMVELNQQFEYNLIHLSGNSYYKRTLSKYVMKHYCDERRNPKKLSINF